MHPHLCPLPSRERKFGFNALRMKIFRAIILAIIMQGLATCVTHAEKVRTAIPQANLNYLSVFVADGKGFFREEGLDNETVVISGPLSIAALLSGDVDFSGAGGSGMRAALKGAPIKGIMFQADRVTFYLVADPSIKSAVDLKGKKAAIGSAKTSSRFAFRPARQTRSISA